MTAEQARERVAEYKAGQLQRVLDMINTRARYGYTSVTPPDDEILTEETISILENKGFKITGHEKGFTLIGWR